MSERKLTVLLTRVEWEHILTCVADQLESGIYWGRRDHHTKRAERIVAELERAVTEPREAANE